MIIYLCIKFQSNTPILSKDIARKPKVLRTGQTYSGDTICAPIENGGGIIKLFCNTIFILTPHGPLLGEIYLSYFHFGLSQKLLSMFIMSKIISNEYDIHFAAVDLLMTYKMSVEISM